MSGAAATPSADPLPSPPTSLNGSRQQWDFSVPAGPEQNNVNSFSTKSRHSNDSTSTYPKNSHRHNTNGVSVSRNSSRSGSRTGGAPEPGYLLPNRVDTLGRKDTGLSRTGSEADSLLDLYGRDSANRSAVSVTDSGERTGGKKMSQKDNAETEHTNWIHRDKLARIESEELQLAGIHFPRQVRTGSKSSSRRGRSHDSHSNGINGVVEGPEQFPPAREDKWQRISSPTPVEDVDEDMDDTGEPMSFDLRLPEEIAADPYEANDSSTFYRNPGLRKSSSRIPVLATSPAPIPLEHLEREFPLPRTRGNTIGNGDTSASYGNSALHDEAAVESAGSANSTPTPPLESRPSSRPGSRPGSSNQAPSSPAKQRSQARNSPATGTRKSSVPPNTRKTSGQQKPRAASSSSSTPNRPSTRSGESRPINRPEGDPPWLATMYKPDPRLPPDQQILPTHARKMQQEQWDKEGKLPSTYDRDFAPLAIQTPPPNPVVDPASEQPQEPTTPSSWPLTSEGLKSPDVNNRPGTSGTDHGGYKTMPKVQSPAPTPAPASPKRTPKEERAAEKVRQKEEKEKSCGCCVVM
ncbi:hypothetical protein FQN54_008374 [Arachnomyces sp. PD_36]|nr:hypothetical protein FQN54_008374 [Arachnomyces sp. PD_36]